MSRYEVQSIVKEFQKSDGFFKWLFGSIEPTVYLEREATEDKLKENNLKDYKYLHFATHAYINKEDPNLSAIQFYKDEQNKEDGVLLASEVYNMDVNADLVVLSACETGLGEILKGEGLIGFTRSFLYAGASNLMVSLWKVADRSTAEGMIGFYDRLLDGESYSESLRAVKLDMIESGQFSKPWYWSPFILIGH